MSLILIFQDLVNIFFQKESEIDEINRLSPLHSKIKTKIQVRARVIAPQHFCDDDRRVKYLHNFENLHNLKKHFWKIFSVSFYFFILKKFSGASTEKNK